MSEGWVIDVRGRMGTLELEIAFESGVAPTAIIGPNGAGKTTLLRTIAGARLGLQGKITLSGRTLLDSAAGVTLPPEQRRVGYVPQGHGLFPHLHVLDNVAFGCDRTRARATLERLEAAHLATRRPQTLSGGERQRIALARALAPDPEGLLLDEPLAALDVGKRRQLRTFLADHLCDGERPTLVVTHDARDVVAIATHVVVLERGRVTQAGPVERVAADPATDFVAEFFDATPPSV
jgi:ABC-type sulfate/molybdate transport systems ATPase subunit